MSNCKTATNRIPVDAIVQGSRCAAGSIVVETKVVVMG